MKTGPDNVVSFLLLFLIALGIIWLMSGETPGRHHKVGQNVLRKFLRLHRWFGDILHAWDVALTTYYTFRERPLKQPINEAQFPPKEIEPRKKRKAVCS